MTNLYFAYGSNMNPDTLARRLGCGDALFRRRLGVLVDYELLFDKVSSTDTTVGYANIVPRAGKHVEGIINELTDEELALLDSIELVPQHYSRGDIPIRDVASGKVVLAQVYRAQTSWRRPRLRPLRGYLEGLLGGADFLSENYAAQLRTVICRD